MIKSFKGKKPVISGSAYVADSAVVIGDVVLCDNVSVWENAVLRGDENSIYVGENSNVQDNCTVHCDFDAPVVIGKNVTIGHNAVIHGCRVGDNCLIGMGAIVLNGAEIGSGSVVGAGSLVTQKKIIPEKSVAMGSPAVVKREASEGDVSANIKNADIYADLIKNYK